VLVGARDGGDRGRGGQDGDDDGAVGRGLHLEGERCQQREADDDAGGDDGQRAHLVASRPRGARRGEIDRREGRRDRRAAKSDDPGIEVLDGEPCGGQREGEPDDPERSESEPGGQRGAKARPRRNRLARRGRFACPCRYPSGRDNVTRIRHAQW
jgi:hypothetical protein